MAVWGWGYGGYLTIRTLAQDSRISTILKRSSGRFSQRNTTVSVEDSLLKCGVSVAPIVQWQHHNPLYTQRYSISSASSVQSFQKTLTVDFTAHEILSTLLNRYMGKPDLEDNWDNYNSADLTKYVFS